MKRSKRQPAAFPLDQLSVIEADYVPGAGAPAVFIPDPEVQPQPDAEIAKEILAPRDRRWLRLLLGALGGLLTLAVGLAIDALIRDLFSRNDALGWLAVGLAALAVVAIIVLSVREIAGLLRLRRITKIHQRAVGAVEDDDRSAARAVARDLDGVYGNRPDTARGRAALATHAAEIIDGRDLIGLAETELLLPLDEAARRMVLASAKRVALVTAISPRAFVDLLFVGIEILRLIRRLATIYGGRPGTLGFVRLTRAAVTHLAVTGGIAAGDSLIQQILGHGIAARLSARLGEGVINGLLTARVGIAAIEVCRPLPFVNGRPPRLGDVLAELRRLDRPEAKDPSADKAAAATRNSAKDPSSDR